MPIGAPGASGHAPRMMGREAAPLSHKAKRGLLGYPGKPLRAVWCKREQPLFGTDHHVVPPARILDARDNMSRLVGRIDCGTRAGRRGGGLVWTHLLSGLRARSQLDDGVWRVLRDEASEIRHLLLQSGDLRLQG